MFRLLMRVPVPWVFVLAYLIGVGLEFVWPVHVGAEVNPAVSLAVGGVVFTLGAVIAGWGLRHFAERAPPQCLAGSPRSWSTGVPIGSAESDVRRTGGRALGGRDTSAGLAGHSPPFVPAYVNWIVIPVEQAKLTEAFGQEYADYRRRVRRWL